MKLILLLSAVCSVIAAETVVTLDPDQTKIGWSLEGNLHTVHGTFQLKSGLVRFDPDRGVASGLLLVGAASGQSGNDMRDKKMRTSVLEVIKFPEIAFIPTRIEGKLPSNGTGTVQLHGVFKLHGTEQQMTLPLQLTAAPGGFNVHTTFKIHYVKWGLKNPGNFMLRVSEMVEMDIQTFGKLQ